MQAATTAAMIATWRLCQLSTCIVVFDIPTRSSAEQTIEGSDGTVPSGVESPQSSQLWKKKKTEKFGPIYSGSFSHTESLL